MGTYYAMDDTPAPELYDSGYTDEELDAIFDELAAGAKIDIEDAFFLALRIGLSDGDCVALSERHTVMLSMPRAELDRHVAAIKAQRAAGVSLADAVAAVCGG